MEPWKSMLHCTFIWTIKPSRAGSNYLGLYITSSNARFYSIVNKYRMAGVSCERVVVTRDAPAWKQCGKKKHGSYILGRSSLKLTARFGLLTNPLWSGLHGPCHDEAVFAFCLDRESSGPRGGGGQRRPRASATCAWSGATATDVSGVAGVGISH